jgi:hypothetical protein
MQRYSSNVIEKLFQVSGEKCQKLFIDEILENNKVLGTSCLTF